MNYIWHSQYVQIWLSKIVWNILWEVIHRQSSCNAMMSEWLWFRHCYAHKPPLGGGRWTVSEWVNEWIRKNLLVVKFFLDAWSALFSKKIKFTLEANNGAVFVLWSLGKHFLNSWSDMLLHEKSIEKQLLFFWWPVNHSSMFHLCSNPLLLFKKGNWHYKILTKIK